MPPDYSVSNLADIPSPSLLFFADLIDANLRAAVAMAGSPEKLRPHVKTHKCAEIVRRQVGLGVTKHKVATPAEAELVARNGGSDVMLAYPVVGPNITRLLDSADRFPNVRFSCVADDIAAATELGRQASDRSVTFDIWADADVGMGRTGVPLAKLADFTAQLARIPGLKFRGWHLYEGHLHQDPPDERKREVDAVVGRADRQAAILREKHGLDVPTWVAGGTPTFPIWAALDRPNLERSPGTYVLHDMGYSRFGDLSPFTPAALLLTRVVSKPKPGRMTLDLGHKSVAADPPVGRRLKLLDLPDAVVVMHSEEHLVVESDSADRYKVGDALLAMPSHVCPTCNLHRKAFVISGGQWADTWEVDAARRLTD